MSLRNDEIPFSDSKAIRCEVCQSVHSVGPIECYFVEKDNTSSIEECLTTLEKIGYDRAKCSEHLGQILLQNHSLINNTKELMKNVIQKFASA
jgi:Holliday junction resolvasome RuvABC DNA-binding subunit